MLLYNISECKLNKKTLPAALTDIILQVKELFWSYNLAKFSV